MNKKISIGIHSGHNASVAFVKDGLLEFGIQSERYSRVKNQSGIPLTGLLEGSRLCDFDSDLSIAFNGLAIDAQAWNADVENQDWTREGIKAAYSNSNNGYVSKIKSVIRDIGYVKDRIDERRGLKIQEEISNSLSIPKVTVKRYEHHLCHGASAYYGMGNMTDKVLLLTCDGSGDGICATVAIGHQGKIERIASVDCSHSIGRLYSNITFLMGMVPLEHEFKLMGLAPYSENNPESQAIARDFMTWFPFDPKNPMVWSRKECPPMQYANNFLIKYLKGRRFDHIAAGVQVFVENFLVQWVKNCVKATGIQNVALSGGVFMNVKANQKILEIPQVESLYIFPSCGDESNSIGGAYLQYAEMYGETISPLSGFYLGDAFDNEAVEKALSSYSFKNNVEVKEKENIEEEAAKLLAKNQVVARFKNKMEFGARAMGNRSILGNPSNPNVVREINEMIKNRDFWMPFAPSVLFENSEKYFIKPKDTVSPYMMLTLDSVIEKRDQMIGSLHPYDYTGRPQEVLEELNPSYHMLLKHFELITGESIVLNTSFNIHGEPIVHTPEDALRVFDLTGLKYLAIENFLVSKV